MRDVSLHGLVLAALLGIAGFVAIALAWRSLAIETVAVYQLPYAVSGGLGGIALIAVEVALSEVHLGRRAAARRRDLLNDLSSALVDLVAAACERESSEDADT